MAGAATPSSRSEAEAIVLDGLGTVTIGEATSADVASLAERPPDDAEASPEGQALLAELLAEPTSARSDPARWAVLVARDPDGRVVAVAGYGRPAAGRAQLVGRVERRYQHLGLGTLLVRRLAAIALEHGVRRFRVDVAPGALGLADLLRDCGLRTHWDLGVVTRVDLDLRARRPGWSTPDCRPAGATARR